MRFGGQSTKAWLEGFSYVARENVKFVFEINHGSVNWRESLVCPVTGLFNRVRACFHLLEIECGPYRDDVIYLMEQITPAYEFLSKRYQKVIGAEFLGKDNISGAQVEGVRHEDVTDLSFLDDSIDYILSFDVFEHVPNYLDGFRECYRVLSKGGALLWTVPFIRHRENTIVRAVVDSGGEIRHLLDPEYHGDPVNGNGVLCYYHFGWDLLDDVRSVGFSDVYAILFWSDIFGYLGPESIVFMAVK